MKRYCSLLLSFFFSFIVLSQNTETKKYLLTTKTNYFGISTLSFTDPYLSPLIYNGNGIDFNHESRRFLSLQITDVSIQNKYFLVAGFALNPAKTSIMTYLGANYNWGLEYHLRPMKGLQILIGGSWDIDLGYKEIARNVNNPSNVDLATNINLEGTALYNIAMRRRTLRLQLTVSTPIFGYMFVPLAGVSYYEMFELGNLSNISHFSSVFNKRGINPKLSIDIPFKRTCWKFGLSYRTLKYSANNLVFNRNEISVLVGTTFDMISFAGRKKQVPDNFISTNE
jgi:hypothetical protein